MSKFEKYLKTLKEKKDYYSYPVDGEIFFSPNREEDWVVNWEWNDKNKIVNILSVIDDYTNKEVTEDEWLPYSKDIEKKIIEYMRDNTTNYEDEYGDFKMHSRKDAEMDKD